MTLQPIKDVSEYKRLKQTLRDRFESEKTGDQTLYEEQSKKYKPLLSSQKDLSTTITGCCESNSGKSERRTSSIAAFVTTITEYTKSTTSLITIADSYHSIKLRHSSNVFDGAGIRRGCEISYSATSSTIFISQGSS